MDTVVTVTNNGYIDHAHVIGSGETGKTNAAKVNGVSSGVTFDYNENTAQNTNADVYHHVASGTSVSGDKPVTGTTAWADGNAIETSGTALVEEAKNEETVKAGQSEETPVQYVARLGETAYEAKDFYKAVNAAAAGETIEILQDFDASHVDTLSGWAKISSYNLKANLNGNGHTITLAQDNFLFGRVNSGANVSNLNVVANGGSLTVYACAAAFNNVDVGGTIKLRNNTGAFAVYCWLENDQTISFNNCNVSADMSGPGGNENYNAVFIGYLYGPGDKIVCNFNNCSLTGSISCGVSAIFIGNNYKSNGNYTIKIDDFSFGENAIVRYCCTDSTRGVFDGISAVQSKYDTAKVIIDGKEYDNKAAIQGLANVKSEIFGDHFVYGPADTSLKLQLNDDGIFSINAASDQTVSYYTLTIGLYTNLKEGGTSIKTVSETIQASTGTEVYTTALKNLKFVDAEWVATNSSATQGTIAGNIVYILDGQMYYIISDTGTCTLNGNPTSAQICSLSAYDSNGKLVASCGLSK